MKRPVIFAAIASAAMVVVAASAEAETLKYVGVWEGDYETPIYTKLVMKADKSLTYCEVSSCREVRCSEMAYSGSFDDKFEYQDAFGKWEFVRLSEDEFEGTYTHMLGEVSTAYYEPE